MAYRKKEKSEVWHWCSNCSNFPKKDYEERKTKPRNGKLCYECTGKDKGGSCKKK